MKTGERRWYDEGSEGDLPRVDFGRMGAAGLREAAAELERQLRRLLVAEGVLLRHGSAESMIDVEERCSEAYVALRALAAESRRAAA